MKFPAWTEWKSVLKGAALAAAGAVLAHLAALPADVDLGLGPTATALASVLANALRKAIAPAAPAEPADADDLVQLDEPKS